MALQFNGKNIYGVNFNGKSLTQVNFNGKPVWYALTNCVITGKARVGSTWTAKTTPSEVQDLCSFQWYRGNSLINGANKSTYTTTEDDRGYQLKCVATIGSASATSNTSPTILQDVSSLTLSGVAEEGYSLTANISPIIATGTYQWYRDDVAISGANKSSYTLTHDDAGKYVKCIFTANGNWTGSVSAQTLSAVTGWYPWSDSKDGRWENYPSSPKSIQIDIPANTRVTYLSGLSSKAFVDGEYGTTSIEGYYNDSWHELAKSEPGFSESSCSWSGDTYMSAVRVIFDFQVCRYVYTKISVNGLQRR